MKAIITIEIADDTTQEQLEAAGMTMEQAARVCQKSYAALMATVTDPLATVTVAAKVVDNTKAEATENGV